MLFRAGGSVVKGRPEKSLVTLVEKFADNVDRIVPALGRVCLVTAGQVHVVEDGGARPVMQATGWITGAAHGNADVLWIANGCELLCTNGEEWRSTMRVHHGPLPEEPPKKATKTKVTKETTATKAPAGAAASKNSVECALVSKAPKWSESLVYGIAVQGDRVLVPISGQVLRAGSDLRFEVAVKAKPTKSIPSPQVSSCFTTAGAIYVGVTGGVLFSRDEGQTFEKLAVGTEATPVTAVAEDALGLWVGTAKGEVLLRPPGDTDFVVLDAARPKKVNAFVPTPGGLLVLRESGRLEQAETKKAVKLVGRLSAGGALYSGCVTPSGTVIIAGEGGIFRQNGKGFDAVFTTSAYVVAAFPDGRVVAGGPNDKLFVSYDDAQSFEAVPHSFGAGHGFTAMAAYEGAILATGSFQPLLRLT